MKTQNNIMLDTYYNSKDSIVTWIAYCFSFIICLLFFGIYAIYIINRNNYI